MGDLSSIYYVLLNAGSTFYCCSGQPGPGANILQGIHGALSLCMWEGFWQSSWEGFIIGRPEVRF